MYDIGDEFEFKEIDHYKNQRTWIGHLLYECNGCLFGESVDDNYMKKSILGYTGYSFFDYFETWDDTVRVSM